MNIQEQRLFDLEAIKEKVVFKTLAETLQFSIF